jgi:hypothetical protein
MREALTKGEENGDNREESGTRQLWSRKGHNLLTAPILQEK